jgi:hypothetical protein
MGLGYGAEGRFRRNGGGGSHFVLAGGGKGLKVAGKWGFVDFCEKLGRWSGPKLKAVQRSGSETPVRKLCVCVFTHSFGPGFGPPRFETITDHLRTGYGLAIIRV